jgi:hypothetical protein
MLLGMLGDHLCVPSFLYIHARCAPICVDVFHHFYISTRVVHPCLQAHLYFEVLFAFDQPIEDSLVVELSFSNGLDDGDDVE